MAKSMWTPEHTHCTGDCPVSVPPPHVEPHCSDLTVDRLTHCKELDIPNLKHRPGTPGEMDSCF